jgi:hypothetical protein
LENGNARLPSSSSARAESAPLAYELHDRFWIQTSDENTMIDSLLLTRQTQSKRRAMSDALPLGKYVRNPACFDARR